MRIRPAAPDDVPAILALVRELAAYERAPEQVVATAAQFDAALFAEQPHVHCLVATDGETLVGYAIWFITFSTWLGRHGIYLEDVYVTPSHRGRGVGSGMLRVLARTCIERGYGRLEWSVLDWNTPAWEFYRGVGAVPMTDWTMQRVSGAALEQLAEPHA